MPDYTLTAGPLSATTTTRGGCLLRFDTQVNGELLPLFRPCIAPAEALNPVHVASYPMVPFGNRVREHRFRFEGREIAFKPNQPWFPEYLHGDGWVSDWSIASVDRGRIGMTLVRHGDDVSPYNYVAEQVYALDESSLTIELKVTNAGSESLPFGLGHHPHFAWRPETFVKLGPEGRYWSEDARYMPEAIVPFPADVDFSEFAAPPLRRVNNLIEDWSRQADVIWNNEGLSLTMTASDAFRFLMVFARAPATPSGEHPDFFCLEPMTHRVGGHEQGDGGLATLRPGESMSGSIRFVVGRNPRSP